MEAARVATLRGHEVTLYERNSELGGNLLIASAAPGKEKILWVKSYLATQLKKLGIKVILDTEVTLDLIGEVRPDAMILATGSIPVIPQIPGVDRRNVVNAWDVLGDKQKIKGKRVAVIGGSMVGCETAEYLAEQGKEVTILKIRPGDVAPEMQSIHRMILLERLEAAKIQIFSIQEILEIVEEGVLIRDRTNRTEKLIHCDNVVLALGAKADRRLADLL
jgi:NADPH-dependent 2,4-dienoyl-CoA reductase/sulfur reductase-like enzyme